MKLRQAASAACFVYESKEGSTMKRKKTCCEECAYFIYDEEYESYFCDMSLDEDEMLRFMQGSFDNCPYFRLGDEYAVVRKQT